jgi:hypothetical protein
MMIAIGSLAAHRKYGLASRTIEKQGLDQKLRQAAPSRARTYKLRIYSRGSDSDRR